MRKIYYLILFGIFSLYNIKAQCGCLDDIFKNNHDTYSNRVEKVFSNGFFTEGPAVDSDGNVYFTDLTFTSETGNEPGHIWKYSPITNKTEIYRSPSNMANGMIIENDKLYICEGADTGGRRIVKTDLLTGKSIILIDKYNNKPFNSPNDITKTIDGIIYFTDPRYSGNEPVEQSVNGVYKLTPAGEVELIIDNISMPNGIAVTKDNKKLYVGCNDESEDEEKVNFIAEYFINDNGNLLFNKYIAKFLSPSGPDGIKLGKDGLIYAAIRDDYKPGIYIYSSDGILINKVILPESPSNLIFANEDQKVLYVTAGGSLYRVNL